MPALMDQAQNCMFTGGDQFETTPKIDTKHDPYNTSCRSVDNRAKASAQLQTFDLGNYAGVSHLEMFGGNGSGYQCSGAGEVTEHFKNSRITGFWGGKFGFGNGAKVWSGKGDSHNRSGEVITLSVMNGGAPDQMAAAMPRCTIKNSSDSSRCEVTAGDRGIVSLGVMGIMAGTDMNIRGNQNTNLSADAGAMHIASQDNLGMTSSLGCVNMCAPIGGIAMSGLTHVSIEGRLGVSMYSLGNPIVISPSVTGKVGIEMIPGFTKIKNGLVHINCEPTANPKVVDIVGQGPPGKPPIPSMPIQPSKC